MDNSKQRLDLLIKNLKSNIVKKSLEIKDFRYVECSYYKPGEFPLDRQLRLYDGQPWGERRNSHVWFIKDVFIPEEFDVNKCEINIDTSADGYFFGNPQFEIYIDGNPTQGIDYKHTSFSLHGKRRFRLAVYGYIGKFIAGGSNEESVIPGNPIFKATVNEKDIDTEKLYYDVYIPYCALDCLSLASKEYYNILNSLINVTSVIDFRRVYSKEYYASVKKAQSMIDSFYKKQKVCSDPLVTLIGQTHIDVAWLWSKKQVREKVLRSFSTALDLMDKYEDYKFMMSQPALYQMVKEDCPELYERIKLAVERGQWEPNGALYVESDCNMLSGESIARQLLYGKRFFMSEFGVEPKVAWLPDTFGFSGALPQIFKKAGVKSFVTSKLTWNDEDAMPYDSFNWRGIDGSEIFGYFLTAQDYNRDGKKEMLTIYNARLTVTQVFGTVNRYQPKRLNNDVILTYGFGDGGGGPTQEYLETMIRLNKGVEGIPKTESGTLGNFMDKMVDKLSCNKSLPVWSGELYFEHHRGTYTSIAKNKRNNRKAEFALMNSELLSVLAKAMFDSTYQRNIISDCWKKVLVNQFHDVLPGSSVKEVYDETDVEYADVFEKTSALTDDFMGFLQDSIAENLSVVFNPNSKASVDFATVDGKCYKLCGLPSKGYKCFELSTPSNNITVTDYKIGNKFYTVTFDKNYNITGLFDKRVKREIVKDGEVLNKFVAYEDYNHGCDAWEIKSYYREKFWDINKVVSVRKLDEGARAGLQIKREYLDSVITQNIYLYEDGERIDFETTIDWQESHTVLKIQFPIALNYSYTTADSQFGRIERPVKRNTSWDEQRFETCMHKYVDVSEGNYGVSILNDCKYGYDALDDMISLTALKCASFPYDGGDKGIHKFTYSIFPHQGRCGTKTVLESYKLNNPLIVKRGRGRFGRLDEFSLMSSADENIIIETVKMAEDSNDVIVRLYDCDNCLTKTKLVFGLVIDKAQICDITERETEDLTVTDNSVSLTVKPFEIVTLKIKMRKI